MRRLKPGQQFLGAILKIELSKDITPLSPGKPISSSPSFLPLGSTGSQQSSDPLWVIWIKPGLQLPGKMILQFETLSHLSGNLYLYILDIIYGYQYQVNYKKFVGTSAVWGS
jgi:hypothetical protein